MLPYLKEDGQAIVSQKAVMPVTATLAGAAYSAREMIAYLQAHVRNLLVVDTEKACTDIGSSKVLNILLLGAAVHSGALGLSEEDIADAIRARLPEKLHELNLQALTYVKKQAGA